MEKDEQKEKQPGEEPSGETEEKINRKLSCTIDEDGGDEDEEENGPVELGPQIALKEQLEMDKVRCATVVVVLQDDESLRKWKEQLLGSIDLNEVGDVKIQDLTILTPDRPDVVLPIPFVPDAKGFAFAIKDGSRYRLKFSFTVSNNIVSGLRYTNTVWKTGMKGATSVFASLLRRECASGVPSLSSGQHQGDAGNVQPPEGALHVRTGRRGDPIGLLREGIVFCQDEGKKKSLQNSSSSIFFFFFFFFFLLPHAFACSSWMMMASATWT
ncbi:hypothetical protein B296_00033720 [Ensete ventricosum]|uniref:Rho GDP-dissociation inhibitor 1 n=1 Tax=Ensete ventricosum TaxID=4639 RepID=A0A427AA73_ENSVE|nr:hypothetical protein B296_00033720 [Ensete ventricosum]